MKKLFKKGFTLVELLVVIAILAVLAGVSVVAYFGFTSQARQSADEQAVTQMNVALEAQEAIDAPDDVEEAKTVLKDAGFAVDDYVPLEKQNIFYYDQQSNRVLIFDQEDKKVTFPQEMSDKYSQTSEKVGYWFLLNDKTYEWSSFAPADTTSIDSVSSAFADAVESLSETELLRLDSNITLNGKMSGSGSEYYFPSNEVNDVHVDLNGHTITFNEGSYFSGFESGEKTNGSFTFSNGKIVVENPDGAFNTIPSGSNTAFRVEDNANVTLSDCDFIFNPNDNNQYNGYNAFSVNDYAKLTLSNCTVSYGSSDVSGVLLYGVESETNIFDTDITCNSYAISSNATPGLSFDLKVKVDNSSIVAAVTPGILLNVTGDYEISNSYIEGNTQAAIFRAGNAVIDNSVIKVVGDSRGMANNVEISQLPADDLYFPYGIWGSGNMLQIGALIVGDWSNSYNYDASCKLVNTEVCMDDDWTDLPIVYLSQDGNCTTTFEYDDACKFSKKTKAFTGEGQAYLVNSVAETTLADGSKLTRGNIIINGKQVAIAA